MDKKMVGFFACVFVTALLLIPKFALAEEKASNSSKITLYKQKFDSLKTGPTQPFPGAAGQDGWFRQLAVSPAYGEIGSSVALGRKALHEFTSSSLGGPVQTIDDRLITPPDLSRYRRITMKANFYAHTSDQSAGNTYNARIAVRGGPHPGYEILGVGLNSGNGTSKDVVGVNIWLDSFNGVDNNQPIALTVGRNLTWDNWHAVTLIADQAKDRYVSLEVDGRVQDLSAYRLPRSKTDADVWERGQLIEFIRAEIVPNVSEAGSSEDDVYWDNVNIVVERPRKGKGH